jgi:threonine/homoserine/homoserine lactone efflux protein
MFLIYFGFTWLFSSITVQKAIGFVGGLIMIYTGFHLFRTQKKKNEEEAGSKRSSFIVGVLTTVANPYFFLWWVTIGAALILNASVFGFTAFLVFTMVHWSCDLLWDAFVSATVYGTRRFWTDRAYKVVSAFCFIVLVGFGVWFIVSALR